MRLIARCIGTLGNLDKSGNVGTSGFSKASCNKGGVITRRLRASAALLVCLSMLGGCSWFQFPGVYKLTIQQGNIITQEMVDQLEPGMTKRQVNFVLGTPLIQDPFQQNRWDYVYRLRKPNGDVTQERLTVFFEDEKLTHFSGDFQPSSAQSTADSRG